MNWFRKGALDIDRNFLFVFETIMNYENGFEMVLDRWWNGLEMIWSRSDYEWNRVGNSKMMVEMIVK